MHLGKTGKLHSDPAASYEQLIDDLKQVMPETALETKMRKRQEFESLEQGNMRHAEFHIEFTRMLNDLKEIGASNKDPDDLLMIYFKKRTKTLREECVHRKCQLDRLPAPLRVARTWEECKLVINEHLSEKRNLSVLQDRHGGGPNCINTVGRPPKTPTGPSPVGGPWSGNRCKDCQRPGHPTNLCLRATAERRAEVQKSEAYWAKRNLAAQSASGAE